MCSASQSTVLSPLCAGNSSRWGDPTIYKMHDLSLLLDLAFFGRLRSILSFPNDSNPRVQEIYVRTWLHEFWNRNEGAGQ